MVSDADAKHCFSSPEFAVVGASSNPAKFGHKIHAWYLAHDLPVTPVNPASPTVNVGGKDYPAIKSLAELPNPKDTAVSIITAPPITLDVLKLAKEIGIPSVWLQPGTFDDEVIKFAQAEPAFSALVYGPGGRGSSGWCVLVDGEKALKDNGKL